MDCICHMVSDWLQIEGQVIISRNCQIREEMSLHRTLKDQVREEIQNFVGEEIGILWTVSTPVREAF